MSKKFAITMSLCVAIFLLLNVWTWFSGPPATVGVSGWRTMGAPFPVKVENVTYTAAGPVVTVIKDHPWAWFANVGLWLLLSYQFSRWVDQKGAAWWRRETKNQ